MANRPLSSQPNDLLHQRLIVRREKSVFVVHNMASAVGSHSSSLVYKQLTKVVGDFAFENALFSRCGM